MSSPGDCSARCSVTGRRRCSASARPQATLAELPPLSSSAISRAALRASSTAPIGKLMAPTLGCPPPPYRSQMLARLNFTGRGDQGLEPTETLVRKLDVLTETVYTDWGNR